MSEERESIIKDPATYRKMSEPLAGVEATNEMIDAFNKELRELRAKHHIRDVICIVSGCYLSADGTDEIDYAVDLQHGDGLKSESLLAWAFGKAAAQRQEMLSRMKSRAYLEQPGKKK